MSPPVRCGTDPESLAQLVEAERLGFGDRAWSPSQISATLALSGAAGARAVLLPGASPGAPPRGHSLCTWVLDEWELQRIAVAPAARRQGLGTVLLGDALHAARAARARRILLEVSEDNTPAIALYARHGFTVDGRRPGYYPGGLAALLMSRALPSVGPD